MKIGILEMKIDVLEKKIDVLEMCAGYDKAGKIVIPKISKNLGIRV